jgi:uncharacterized damage-inducible protein DinB
MIGTETAAITLDEFVTDHTRSTERWRQWLAAHPDAFNVPCDIFDSKTVGGLIKHIFIVELRHSQRLTGQRVATYEDFPGTSLDDVFAIHDQALTNLRVFTANSTAASLSENLEIQTLSAGTVHASRRKLFVHIMIHSRRHWAQLATLLRTHGLKTDWPQDFLFSEAMA